MSLARRYGPVWSEQVAADPKTRSLVIGQKNQTPTGHLHLVHKDCGENGLYASKVASWCRGFRVEEWKHCKQEEEESLRAGHEVM